jgi:hypothetical protein
VLYTHTNVLRTICDAMGLRECPRAAALANPMTDFFNRVQIISPPAWDATVSSPVQVQAQTINQSTVYAMQLYVDNILRSQNNGATVDTTLTLSPGAHDIVVQSWDTTGGIHKASRHVQVGDTSLQIQSPIPNSTVESPVVVRAQGTGSVNWRDISLVVDGVAAAQGSGNILKTTLSLPSGSHSLKFIGNLANGASAVQEASITVSVPTVTITNPSHGASLPSPVEIRGVATDPVPVSAVQIYIDDRLRYETSGFGVDFPLNLTGGNHKITVRAWNAKGETYKSDVSIAVLPITIAIYSPQAGNVHSPVEVSAVAESDRVIAMQLYVDSRLQYQCSGAALQTTVNLSPGAHQLVIQAWDENGGVWKDMLDVTSN